MSLKRINKELSQIRESSPTTYSVDTINNDLYNWTATIMGPEYSPYENGIFFLHIKFPNDYPFKGPKCTFQTKIYHPNINSKGDITMVNCLDNWSPQYTINQAINEIIKLLIEPCPDDPWEPEIALVYKQDRNQYNLKAAEWTKKYAM